MDIQELLNSTYRLGERRQPAYVFGKKPFGRIYAFNKEVRYKPNNSIIEVTMYMTVATELYKTAHKVSIALQGVKSEEYTKEDLLKEIKNKKLNSSSEKVKAEYTKMSDVEILDKVLSEKSFFNKKTIIQSAVDHNKFLLVDKNIPLSTQVRVKCSCFTGDTEVILGDGNISTLKELAGQTNFSLLAYNSSVHKFEYANAVKCELKENMAKVINVHLSDGTTIKTTPEHRFLKSDNSWTEAKDLREGDSLMIFKESFKDIENHVSKRSYYTYIYLDPRIKGKYAFSGMEVNFEPFYVGVSSGVSRSIDVDECYTRLSEIYEEGFTPIIIKQSTDIDYYVAQQIREKLVNSIGIKSNNSGPLVNRKIISDTLNNSKSNCRIIGITENEERQDVYCITTAGLGNFILKTKENNTGIVVENCSDYYYTFAYYNADHKVHIGKKPPKYTPYRDLKKAQILPIRNPNKYPGVCKHLLLFIVLLMRNKVLNSDNMVLEGFKGKSRRIDIFSRADITEMLKTVTSELRAENSRRNAQRAEDRIYKSNRKKT